MAQYERFPINFPRSSEAPLALFKAGVLYRQLAQISSSNRILERLIKDYPQSPYVARSELLMAANDQSLLRFDQAAEKFEIIGKKYSKDPISAQSFLNASVLRAGMHQYDKAAVDQDAYARRVSDDEEWIRAAHYYQLSGNEKEALKIYKRYISGTGGRDFVIRALFERAQLLFKPKATLNAKEQALTDCRAIQVIQKKYSHSLSAQANHASAGCTYLATWKTRDELLSIDLSKDSQTALELWELISKLYVQIQATSDNDWMALALADGGAIAEKLSTINPSLFKSLAITYYKKSLELAVDIYSNEAIDQAVQGLIRLSPGSIALVRPELLRTNPVEDPGDIIIPWPSESVPLKLAFDRKEWSEVSNQAPKAILGGPHNYLYLAWAHGLGQIGDWVESRRVMADCADKLSDPQCASSLFLTGYQGAQSQKYREIIEKAIKSENRPLWKLSLAQVSIREKQLKNALTFAQQAVGDDPQNGRAYSFISRLFLEVRRPELAKLTLAEGLRNTDSDNELQISMGYLLLNLRLMDELQSLMDEIKTQEIPTIRARIFLADGLLVEGKNQESNEMLSFEGGTDGDKAMLTMAKFSNSLIQNDGGKSSDLIVALQKISPHFAQANYLLGIYSQSIQKDFNTAKKYFVKAKDLGQWGKWFEMTIQTEDRKPSAQPTEKGK